MRNIVDIHSHILPNMDDGSQSLESTMHMAMMAVESGVCMTVATPHSIGIDSRPEMAYQIRESVDFFNNLFEEEGIPLKLFTGMEIFAREDVPELLTEGILLPINGTRNVLIEFDFQEEWEYMTYILNELIKEKYAPIIAHPERYTAVMAQPVSVEEWLEMGCKLQLNKGSILGRFGESVRQCAVELLENDAFFAVAGDAHSAKHRTPHMSQAVHEITRLTDKEKAQKLFCENPRSLLQI